MYQQESNVVKKLIKVDLQCFCLYLYKTPVQAECFAYWMLSIKSDKPQF